MPSNADCPILFENQDSTSGFAKLFEIGEYPDKDFSLTDSEADDAISHFSPVPNDLEHKQTILSGKLGTLESVFRIGREIFGRISIPKWLRELNDGEPIKVSLAWSKNSPKRIVGNALVLNPRISDAQVFAAFSDEERRANGSPLLAQVPTSTDTGGTKVPKSKFLDRLLAVFSRPAVVEEFAKLDGEPEESTPEGHHLGSESSEAAFAAQQAQLSSLQARLLENEAEKFYLAALGENRVVPAERETLIAQFKQAAVDDNAGVAQAAAGVACFSAEGRLIEGPRLALLKEAIAARPSHDLTSERLESLIKDKGELVAFDANPKSEHDPETKKLSKERRKQLIDAGTIKPSHRVSRKGDDED